VTPPAGPPGRTRRILRGVHPLWIVLIIAGVAAACCWVASLITSDTSWVDRLWSIVPVVYAWVFAAAADGSDVRLDLMAVLVTVWGVRLTFNFARKGGYTGTEDYRWAVLRARMRPWQFQVFNLFFIVLYQQAILVLITLPCATAYAHRSVTTPLDWLLALVFLGCTVGETIADQQQWNFQRWRGAEVRAGRTPTPGFLMRGLFHYARHPNFFFEQAQWWVLFLIGAVAARSLLQWTALGAFLLTILFVGSTRFTESISKSKYPEYADYQRATSPIVPWWPRHLDSPESGRRQVP